VIVFRAKLKCLGAPVRRDWVKAGPFSGRVRRPYDVVDGRFRLHVGLYRDRASGLPQSIPWFVSRKYRVARHLVVRGTRLAPPGDTFRQSFHEARTSGSPDRHLFRSNISPPSSGCWRLTLRSGLVTAAVTAWVDG
jgi:hypothetical protein